MEQFRVIVPPTELQKLKRWGAWAVGEGAIDDFLITVKTINFRLSYEPLEWGEAKYSLHHLDLEIRLGTFRMLNVWYGVNEQARLVIVKAFQFRGDYPLGRPPD